MGTPFATKGTYCEKYLEPCIHENLYRGIATDERSTLDLDTS